MSGCSAGDNALRSGYRMQSYGIKIRFTSGCSAGVARCVRDPEVYITVSVSDLRRGVAQWLARFVRSIECNATVLKYDFCRGVAQG